ncbi:acidic leucine-rich nuclear phosphoprotein 32 family member A-like [Penaeus indicus]|uniref:acidic leucine-rich nuclear phosphoprotein 32 family member A-like n=1 Tax=Penaeus indicus TaxID=29960 RepID=UPI00300D0C9F
MESFLEELQTLEVPVWTQADLLEHTRGCRSSLLGRGFSGEAQLLSDAHRCLVVKRIGLDSEEFFFQEARALAKVRDALKRLHEAGVAHRDLHDDNVCVLLGEERVRAEIIDFGVAHFEADHKLEEFKQNDLYVLADFVEETRRLFCLADVSKAEPSADKESEEEEEEEEEEANSESEEDSSEDDEDESQGPVSVKQLAGLLKRRRDATDKNPFLRQAAKRRRW